MNVFISPLHPDENINQWLTQHQTNLDQKKASYYDSQKNLSCVLVVEFIQAKRQQHPDLRVRLDLREDL